MSGEVGPAIYPDIAGCRALVTGGASGIGAAIAGAFLCQGAQVSVLDIGAPEAALAALPEAEKRLTFYSCDVADAGALEVTVANAGPVDILVNNVAQDERHTLAEADATRWNELMAVNLKAAHLAARAVAPAMVTAGQGVIINLSSNCFLVGLEGYPVYATAKAGLWGLTRALARELGHDGVRVNCLVPGWVMTPRQKALHVTREALEECLRLQCLKDTIEPNDIANACLFLASKASRMMTGQMLVVDGGRA